MGMPVLFLLYKRPFLKHSDPCGKNDIRKLSYLSYVGCQMSKERYLCHRLFPSLSAGAGERKIIHISDGDLYLIGFVREYAGSNIVGNRSAA